MNKGKFIHQVHTIKSVDDLIIILNSLRIEKYGEQCSSITKNLLFYLASNNTPISDLYTVNFIPKKAGGTRKIQVPCKKLKEIQKYIEEVLNALYSPESYVTGFVRGKNIIENAKPHVGHKYLVTWDIRDFFGSLHAKLIKVCLIKEPFNFPDDVANIITNICSVRISEDSNKRILPQGAPTSPILSNIIFAEADKIISDICEKGHSIKCSWYGRRRGGVTYTRYADDMTFSADWDFYHDCRFSWGEIKRDFRYTFRENLSLRPFYYLVGLQLSKKKTRRCKNGQRKVVTGIVVNEKLNVKREFVREIRDLLYIWEKYGYEAAQKRYYIHCRRNSAIKTPNSELLNILVGKINFIKQVKGGNDATFNRLKSKLVQLCTKQNNPQLITILLLTGMKLRGELIDLDLDKGITISIAGLKRTIPINTIKEIIQED